MPMQRRTHSGQTKPAQDKEQLAARNWEQGMRKVPPIHRHEASPRSRTFSTELSRSTSPKAP